MIPGRTIAFLLGTLPWLVRSQRAQCLNNSTFSWSFNQEGQSPCDVAIALGGVCAGPLFTLKPLPATFVYLGPPVTGANQCQCSTVYYSMLSACSNCQGRDWLGWSVYNQNCSTVYSQVFPSQIPAKIGVPAWAYLDVTTKDTFDAVAAQNTSLADAPDSTALPSPTATGNSGPTSFTSNFPASSSGGGKKTNVGAIVGGVVGGIVALGLIIGLVVWILLRKRKAQRQGNYTPTAASAQPLAGQTFTSSTYPQTPMTQAYTGSTTPYTPQTKLYDPNDPSTFPVIQESGGFTPVHAQTPNRAFSPQIGSQTHSTTPDPFMQQQGLQSHRPLSPSFTGTSSAIQARTNYTGAPELG